MSNDDDFDLDVRITPSRGIGDGARASPVVRTLEDDDQGETAAPQATCPAETCGLDCQTLDCTHGCETHGCNTSETCDQVVCSDAITFGPYCEDQSDDTCHACPGGSTAECADPPD